MQNFLERRNSLLKHPVRISYFLNIEKLPVVERSIKRTFDVFAVVLLMLLLFLWIFFPLFISVLDHSV